VQHSDSTCFDQVTPSLWRTCCLDLHDWRGVETASINRVMYSVDEVSNSIDVAYIHSIVQNRLFNVAPTIFSRLF
jgi:hypothetical protein